jgi:hypothetical protein
MQTVCQWEVDAFDVRQAAVEDSGTIVGLPRAERDVAVSCCTRDQIIGLLFVRSTT